jgi:hypothetical protein
LLSPYPKCHHQLFRPANVQGAAEQLSSLSSLISGQGHRLDRELGQLSRCESEEQLDSFDQHQQQHLLQQQQLYSSSCVTPDKLISLKSLDQNYR